MSGPQFDDQGNLITDPQGQQNGMQALRKAIKEKAKENKELLARIEALEAQTRSGSVADALAIHGLDPRVAKLYPADRPTTADAVAQWVDDNGDLLAPLNSGQNNAKKTTLTPDQQEGYRIMKQLGEAEAATQLDFNSRMAEAKSEADVMNILREFGEIHAFG